MEKMGNKFFKKIIASVLLVIMIMSYIPSIVMAIGLQEENDDERQSEYINFSVNDNSTQEVNIKTGETKVVPFSMVLSGVATGFEDVSISIYQDIEKSDEDIGKLWVTYNNTGSGTIIGSTLQFTGNTNTINLNSTFNLIYDYNTAKQAFKSVVIVYLSGKYKDPLTKETVSFGIEKEINVSVEPSNIANMEYNLGLGNPQYAYNSWDQYLIGSNSLSVNLDEKEEGHKVTEYYQNYKEDFNDIYEWSTPKIDNRELGIKGEHNYSMVDKHTFWNYVQNVYYEEYELELSRDIVSGEVLENKNEINSEDNLKIYLSKIESIGFTTEIIRNDDGTTIIKLIKGNENATDPTQLYSNKENASIVTDWKIPESESHSEMENINSKLELISLKIKGYNILPDETYQKTEIIKEVESNKDLKSDNSDSVDNILYPNFSMNTSTIHNVGNDIYDARNKYAYIKPYDFDNKKAGWYTSNINNANLNISNEILLLSDEETFNYVEINNGGNKKNIAVFIDGSGNEKNIEIPNDILTVTGIEITDKSDNIKNIYVEKFKENGTETTQQYIMNESEYIPIPKEDNISTHILKVEIDENSEEKNSARIKYNINAEISSEKLDEYLIQNNLSEYINYHLMGIKYNCNIWEQSFTSTYIYEETGVAGAKSNLYMQLNDYDCGLGETLPELLLTMKHEHTTGGKLQQINGEWQYVVDFYSKNTNPKIYVELADDFSWDIKSVTMSSNNSWDYSTLSMLEKQKLQKSNIKISDYYKEVINGVQYLVIECDGVFDYFSYEDINISVKFKRTSKNASLDEEYLQNVYMFTEEEEFPNKLQYDDEHRIIGSSIVENELELKFKDKTPNKVFYLRDYYDTDVKNDAVTMESIIKIGIRKYIAQYDQDKNYAVKVNPFIVMAGKVITYINRIDVNASGVELNNINFVVKLPKQDVTSVQNKYLLLSDDDEQDGIDGYVLPEKYFSNKKEGILGSVNKNSAVPEISMINLNNISVSVLNKRKQEVIDSSQYTLYYTEMQNVDFSTEIGTDPTTSFVKVEETTDLSTAVALKVVMNENFTLSSLERLQISYDMTMPETDGMVGQVAAVKYQETNKEEPTIQEPVPAYVIRGNPTGTVKITKKFEGLNAGTIPAGETAISGIGFKLLDLYNNKTPIVIQGVTDANGIVLTDENGIATFTNVPEGTYQVVELEETAEFQNYDYNKEYAEVVVEQGNTCEKTVENPIKKSTVTINKSFEDTNDILGKVTFKLTRTTTTDNIKFEGSIETDENGVGTLEGVPYGKYKIEEISGVYGWYVDSIENVTIDEQQESINIENKLAKGTIVINKTVPAGDTVDGLKFKFECVTPITYTNKAGEKVVHSVNQIVEVGGENDTNVNIQNNGESVVITVSDLPAGTYKVTEVDIPQIDTSNGAKEDRYEIAKGVTTISKNGETKTVNLVNNWKMGRLSIEKTADKGVDLEQFAVRVTGTSYYGTQVDKTLYLNSEGKISTALEIGKYKVEEIESDYFNAEYSYDGITYSIEPKTYEVKANGTTTAYIKNNSTYGYVKINKTLEGRDASAAQGIKFYVQGISPTGANINEEIVINEEGVGISKPIPAGGEYILVEDEDSIPAYFVGVAEQKIEITKHNTITNPVVFNIENTRGHGNLQLITTTNPEGEVPYPITYKINEINILQDGSYEIIEGTEKTIEADLQGEVIIPNLPSGLYLAQQESIPDGWEKDVQQIVEVPVDNTGIAIFEITRKQEWQKTKVVISKEMYNEEGIRASVQDFENALLNENESFEVQIRNINTKEIFYVFISENNKGTITGLEPGKYEIVEIGKFKYENIGIYENSLNVPELQKENEKYVFEIPDVEGATVNLLIRNKINTNFKFGGSVQKDNYAKTETEVINSEIVTKAVVYVVDEEGKVLPGATFKILDSQGKQIQISAAGNEITTISNRILIRGLESGTYKFVNTSVPEGYLQPADTTFTVYKDATRVVRVEIQKNIVRGSLLLSTVYKTEDNETEFTSRSKYKVLNKETNEFVTFTKKADGTYQKSNLPNAVNTIALKAGKMAVSGLEKGNYEIGLVDVTEGYGIVKNTVEQVNIETSDVKEISVQVQEKIIVSVESGEHATYMLDSDGKVWFVGNGNSNPTGAGNSNLNTQYIPLCISDIEAHPFNNVKVEKIETIYGQTVAIDKDGKVWMWGNNTYLGNLSTPVCISDEETETLYNKKIIDIAINGSGTVIAIDNDGNVYSWGNKYYLGIENNYQSNLSDYTVSPICINNAIENHPLSNVKAVKCEAAGYVFAIIDENGRVWTWAGGTYSNLGYIPEEYNDSYQPVCISELKNNPLNEQYKNGIEIVEISGTYGYSNLFMALDSLGRIWTWGENSYGQLGNGTTNNSELPLCVNEQECNNQTMSELKFTEISAGYNFCTAVDEYGKVWTWGYNNYVQLGNGTTNSSNVPVCISDDSSEKLTGTRVEKIYAGYGHVSAIDNSNQLWGWGYNYDGNCGTSSENNNSVSYYCRVPAKCNFSLTYNEVFDYNFEISKVVGDYSFTVMLDTNGRVWAMGNLQYAGAGVNSTSVNIPTYIEIDSKTTFIDIAATNTNTIVLDSEGRVWTTGGAYNGCLGNNDTSYNGDKNTFICISEQENNPIKGVKIEKIYAGSYSIYAIDEDGKIWCWGNNFPDGNKRAWPECITNLENTELNEAYKNGTTIKKIDVDYNNNMVALDSNGKIWIWSSSSTYGANSSSVKCVTDIAEDENALYKAYQTGIRIIDVEISQGCTIHAIDSEGKLWNWGSYSSDIATNEQLAYPTCISNIEGNKFKELYDNNVKLVKVQTGYYTGIYVVDNNGKLWVYGDPSTELGLNSGNITCISEQKDSTLYNLSLKNIFATYDSLFVIDTDREIWVSGNNNEGKLGNGSTTSINNPQSLYGKLRNLLYKVKVIDITSNGDALNCEVVDENNNSWTIGNKATMSGVSITEERLKELENKGVVITQYEIYNSSSNSKFITALDNEGKVWFIGTYTGIGNYIGDGSGDSINEFTALNKLYNDGVRIKRIERNHNQFVLLSEDGKVHSPANMNDYTFEFPEGVEITNVLGPINFNFGYDQTMSFIDNKGNIWVLGNSSFGLKLGVTYSNVKTPQKIISIEEVEDFEFGEVIIDDTNGYVFYKDKSGNLCTIGLNTQGQCGDGTTYNRTTPYNTGIKVDKICTSGNSILVLDTDGNVWGTGANTSAQLGTGDRTNKTTFVKIAAATSTYKFKEIYFGMLIDSLNNIWVWNSSSPYKPVMNVNNGFGAEYKDKAFKARVGNLIQTTDGSLFIHSNSKITQIGTATGEKTITSYVYDDLIYGRDNYFVKYDDGTFDIFHDASNSYNKIEDFNSMKEFVTELINLNENCSEMTASELIEFVNSECYVSDDGKLYLWNSYSSTKYFENVQLTNEILCVSEKADSILYGKTMKDVVHTNYFTYAIDTDGNLYVWGREDYLGQLSDSTNDNYYPKNLSEIDVLKDASLNHGWYIKIKKYGF